MVLGAVCTQAGDPTDVVKLIGVDEPRDPGPGQVVIRSRLPSRLFLRRRRHHRCGYVEVCTSPRDSGRQHAGFVLADLSTRMAQTTIQRLRVNGFRSTDTVID